MKVQRSSETGFSLVETVITLVIFCILVTLALTTFGKQKVQFQRQDIARQLKVYLDRARFDSMKRDATTSGEMAHVTITSAYSFSLASDLNLDGVLDAYEIRQINMPRGENVKITGSGIIFPVTVSFNFRGQMTAVDGNNSPINPVFTICDSGCSTGNANGDNSNIVAVSPAGTVSLLDGGKSPLQVVQPDITDTSIDGKINQAATINN